VLFEIMMMLTASQMYVSVSKLEKEIDSEMCSKDIAKAEGNVKQT